MAKRTTPIPAAWMKRAPRLATIVRWVNEHTSLIATLEAWRTNTDRKYSGQRYVFPGKGRAGKRLLIFARSADALNSSLALFSHHSGETYRRNSDVVRWLDGYLTRAP
jgi:hypothetical protein